MIKFLLLVIMVAVGFAYYMGFFTADDSPKDMMEKVQSAASEKLDSMADGAKEKLSEGIDKAKESVK